MKVKSEREVTQLLRPHGLQPTRLLYPWDFPGKSAGHPNPTLTFQGQDQASDPSHNDVILPQL